jgi:hypothetical protein
MLLHLLAPFLFLLPSGENKVTISLNGKVVKNLTETLYLKPGAYKAPPVEDVKRKDFTSLTVTTPTEGLDPADSLSVELIGYSGKSALFRNRQMVAAGQSASFDIGEPAMRDFSPQAKNPTLLARFDIEVIPKIRANTKGQYKGSFSIK